MHKTLKVLGCTFALGLMATTSVFASPDPTATNEVEVVGGAYNIEISHAMPFETIEIRL